MIQPLDYNPSSNSVHPDTNRVNTIGQYLEMIPIIILSIGMFMYYQGMEYWKPVILFGGGIAVMIYTIFCYLMYRIDRYTNIEFGLSLLMALLFPLGVSGILFPEYVNDATFIEYGLYAGAGLFGLSVLMFIINIQDERAALFYRSMMARVLVLGVILVRLWI